MKINSLDVKDIIKEFGTPLYIYDIKKVKEVIGLYKNNFKSNAFECEVAYASKAFSILPFVKILKDENLSIDVVSMGEALTAINAGFVGKNIYLHGNNKTIAELKLAIEKDFNIVLDNLEELKLIQKLNQEYNKNINLLLRINFGIEAHTHKYILTGNLDSKFGVIYKSKDYEEILNILSKEDKIKLLGFHSHIGSQIFELEPYYALIDKYAEITKELKEKFVFSLGGGFGVRYTNEDKPIPTDVISKKLVGYAENKFKDLPIAKLVIEPGRSIVSDAGIMVYELGFKKQTPNKLYYFVNGGMSDNIRPAIYQAKYSCEILGKEDATDRQLVTIGGKCCESGDILIEDVMLPDYEYGDVLVVYNCGAYSYQMASNYNKNLRPGIVFVYEDKFEEVVKEEYEDLA